MRSRTNAPLIGQRLGHAELSGLDEGRSLALQQDGRFLYARVAQIADCTTTQVPESARPLCEPTIPSTRPGPNFYAWSADSPFATAEFPDGTDRVDAARQFATAVIVAQPGDYVRMVAQDTAQAEQALLQHRFGLIVLGVNFDESRMFELLAHVRAQERHKVTPVLCVLGPGGRASEMAVEAIDRAAKAMLANAFLWLAKFPEDEEGDRRIRRIADYLILIDGDMHHGVKEA